MSAFVSLGSNISHSVMTVFRLVYILTRLRQYSLHMKVLHYFEAGCIAQLVMRLTQEPEVPDSIPSLALTFVSLSADSRRAVVSY